MRVRATMADISHSSWPLNDINPPCFLASGFAADVSQYLAISYQRYGMRQSSIEPQPTTDDAGSAGRKPERGKSKAKEARRDPEKRRQQNQRAQQKYRQKRRQRILELENLASAIASASDVGSRHRQDAHSHEPWQDMICQSVEPPPHPLPGHNTSGDVVPHTDSRSGPPTTTTSGDHGHETVGPGLASTWRWHAPDITNDGFASEIWSIRFFDCGCEVPHIPTPTAADLAGVRGGPASRTLETVNFFSDPYANMLRVDKLCSLEAMRRNCLAIGISVDMCYSDDSVSPFFRDADYGADPSSSLVQSVQGIFRTLKPDLRPCSEQITVSHHPYIDILPFPSVRANLIRSIGSIDEDEFFYDSINGLICWGGAARSRGGTTGVGTGTPWDVRSWEAKEWYLQKWWFIVGGEEGELVRQSRWWRALRGEDLE
ncbi:hypothetical protein GGS23DRAFT_558673 [Durotheca rogersii]|uniref:uncharacterized protein n=1 Tax=Durotheca rogersii TaxID=419775 RepID=UPI00221EB44D|nr:uncharacterized protein GGS23DRAFT_558673 [Durotheca rogersii]KAI5865312.1 hypothetical protein GGS23DRAFT_558673 [Durotheca rogersii]